MIGEKAVGGAGDVYSRHSGETCAVKVASNQRHPDVIVDRVGEVPRDDCWVKRVEAPCSNITLGTNCHRIHFKARREKVA